ncbi:hypothetical protein LTR10_019128 [Elasticomyces elasticus]|uniref:ORC6 first cyclin-like domain-containing protein n=1 Tax=Exophiala sideris TaxID=1016849 RepID=A0ABR0JJ16_9EURO|nr:hypothetical protein LTR10_019128 [Elasticomyces elasticus]KAK5033464.1 hypothetical protein LTS07_003768 [Exophiala sideris]KAK5042041.1 hypothetical protein LTR13_001847 [Exophiala sideris]KAK5064008.1 hypothetical protein LTR69_003776 [Exophiala sideris]KAK5185309.1 hypothetical protein LTR44_002298 [Eurotiomycetes sp. CCFEE 6388]
MPASSAIQQSLTALLPTYAQKLPAKLIHLSESLLAQSRQRASQLKPDEEIARAYACCEIACKRLRAQCRLPAVKAGGAPCKPAVYKKLVTFLERVLDEDAAASTPKSTPGGRKITADGNPKVAISVPSTITKISNPQPNPFLGKLKASVNKSDAENLDNNGAPAFLMSSIRRLCKVFSTVLLAPHVYTGTCIILKLAEIWPREDGSAAIDEDELLIEDITGLLVALYLMTLTRMMTAKMTTSVYKTTCAKAVEELNYKPGAAGVEAWIRRINREGYCGKQDWWMSVPESVFDFDPNKKWTATALETNLEGEDDGEDMILSSKRRRRSGGKESKDLEEQDDPEGVLLPGLLTMMQNAVDFLSEERTRKYEAWKKQFLKKLDKMVKTPAVGARRAIAVE